MLFNTINLIFLNVTMPNWTTKICAQISLAGFYYIGYWTRSIGTVLS